MGNRALLALRALLVISLLTPATLQAQTMEEAFNQLFVFGSSDDPLFLGGSANFSTTQVHGMHFIPSESETNGALLGFFNSAISSIISTFPLSSTVSSETFRFVDGVPTPTSTSFGPIYAERAQTIGRGRVNAGANWSRLNFSQIRGVNLKNVEMTFVHVNADFEGCDEIFGDDCTQFGVPQVENDLINLNLNLDIETDIFAFFATFGLTDWLDLSVAVPVVGMEMRGSSTANAIPSTPDQALHFFGGTPENPVLQATTQSAAEVTGIGDISARLKAHAISGEKWDVGILGEVRFPTGSEEDFLGSGDWNVRGLFITSGRFGDFSPHANVGYEYRGAEFDQDIFWLIAGFDHRLASWATLAADFLGAFRVGDRALEFPQEVNIDAPFQRVVRLTNIPNRRDDILHGSFGFKFRTGPGLVIITNVLVPLNSGGIRSSPIPTIGLEYTI